MTPPFQLRSVSPGPFGEAAQAVAQAARAEAAAQATRDAAGHRACKQHAQATVSSIDSLGLGAVDRCAAALRAYKQHKAAQADLDVWQPPRSGLYSVWQVRHWLDRVQYIVVFAFERDDRSPPSDYVDARGELKIALDGLQLVTRQTPMRPAIDC